MSLALLTIDGQLFFKENTFLSDENQDLTLDILETHSFAKHVASLYEEIDINDVHVIRYDHEESI